MSFIESPRFPDCVSFGAQGGAGFKTDIVVVNSGRESRNQRWSQSRAPYEVSHNAKLPEIYKPLQQFFRIAAGKANAFRFKDWLDYTVIAGEGFFEATTDSPIEYQLLKRYTWGAFTMDRVISKPIATISVTGGTVSSVDYTTGKVRMTSGVPTVWTGEFDVPCRFDVDEMIGDIQDKTPGGDFIINWRSIPIVEVRV